MNVDVPNSNGSVKCELLILQLMRAGLELDPAAEPPRLREDTTAHRFATFDIILRNI
jgi:hypothetical protein